MASMLLLLAAAACASGDQAREPAPSSTPAPTPTSTAPSSTPSGQAPSLAVANTNLTLKVVSYNLLWGAGVERRFDENIPARFHGQDRLPQLMAFLREANPDVLALQEAAGWDVGEPSVAELVARELGMTYVLAPDAWELHVVLFSRYPIVSADYVSRLQDFNGVALRATLAVTPEVDVNVIAVHLNSMSSQARSCQVEAVLDMAADLEGRTLLLGDFNFRPESRQAELLHAAGWQLLAAQERWPIDQVWVDGSAGATAGDWWRRVPEPERISDHWPIGVEVALTSPPSPDAEGREPVGEPQPLDYACPLPPR